jgi:hypothetical protein
MRRGNVFPWFEVEDTVGSDLLDRVILHCTRLTLAVTINVCPSGSVFTFRIESCANQQHRLRFLTATQSSRDRRASGVTNARQGRITGIQSTVASANTLVFCLIRSRVALGPAGSIGEPLHRGPRPAGRMAQGSGIRDEQRRHPARERYQSLARNRNGHNTYGIFSGTGGPSRRGGGPSSTAWFERVSGLVRCPGSARPLNRNTAVCPASTTAPP